MTEPQPVDRAHGLAEAREPAAGAAGSAPLGAAEPVKPGLDRRASIGGALLGALWVSLPPLFGFALLLNVDDIKTWLDTHQGSALIVYTLGFALCAGIGLFPTYAQALVGGWVFGFRWGFLGAIGGFVGGAALGYLVSRLAAGDGFVRWIDARPRYRVIRQALVGSGFWRTLGTVALIRFPPNSPFALTNLAMAAGGTRPVPFLLGTAIGMAPRTAIAVYVAANAAASGEKNFQSILVNNPIGFAVGLGAMVVAIVLLASISKAALRRAGLEGTA